MIIIKTVGLAGDINCIIILVENKETLWLNTNPLHTDESQKVSLETLMITHISCSQRANHVENQVQNLYFKDNSNAKDTGYASLMCLLFYFQEPYEKQWDGETWNGDIFMNMPQKQIPRLPCTLYSGRSFLTCQRRISLLLFLMNLESSSMIHLKKCKLDFKLKTPILWKMLV